jgi:dynein intermediate chain 1, axonemal
MELKLVGLQKEGEAEDETSLSGLAGGCCFDFNKTSEHLFIVGTEEGKIHKCSKAYNSQYLDTYEGHYMAVYGVRWNHFHPRVFLSSSADCEGGGRGV